MIAIPNSEREKFINVLCGQAQRFGLTPEEYLRKVWYHEEASRFGEYIAMTLLEELLPLIPETKSDELEKSVV